MPTGRDDTYLIAPGADLVAGVPPAPPSPPPPPPPPAPTISIAAPSTATAGQAVTITLTAADLTGALPTTAEVVSGPGAVFTPSTATPAPADLTKLFSAVFSAAGAAQVRATASAGSIVSNTLSIAVSAAPAPPPPPPAPAPPPTSGTIAAVALTDAAGGAVPFCIGHAFRQGELPAGTTIATHQVAVKTTWPDGSAKIAVVAGETTLTAGAMSSIYLATGAAPTGAALTTATLKATGISASLGAGAFGSASWAANSSDWDAPFVAWVSGPLMSSWVYRKPIGSDAHLVAWMEVRLWASGKVEVLPWVENGYADVAGPTTQTETFTFTLGGTVRYSGALSMLSHTRAPLISGAATAHWLVPNQHDTVVRHDTLYMQATGLVPSYQVEIAPSAATIAALPTMFAPLQQGVWDSSLASVGWHAHVDVIPEWEGLYLTCSDARTWKGAIFQGYSAGRFNWNWRDSASNRAPLLANYATKNITTNPPGNGWDPLPVAADEFSNARPQWSLDHGPSIGYVCYLMTGRWYFLDQLQMAHAADWLNVPALAWRQSALGILDPQGIQVRGAAWGIRTLTQALCATPDDDTAQRNALITQLQNNIDWWDAQYTSPGGARYNALGWVLGLDGGNYEAVNGNTLAGSTTTVLQLDPTNLRADTTSANHFAGQTISIGGQTRTIQASNSTAGTVTLSTALPSAPAAGVAWSISDGRYWDAPWMQHYVSAALGAAKHMALPISGGHATKFDAFMAWKMRTTTGPMGSTASTDWLYRECGLYTMPLGTCSPSDSSRMGAFYASWGDMYANAFLGTVTPGSLMPPGYASPGAKVDGNLRQDFSHTGQFANFMRAAAYAVQHGVSGAAAGWARITGTLNYLDFQAAMEASGRCCGALAPAKAVVPTHRRGQAIGEFRALAGSNDSALAASSVARTLSGGSSSNIGRLDCWTGLSVDRQSSTLWGGRNGGHGDYYGNEVTKLDLLLDSPVWVEVLAGSNGNVIYDAVDIPDSADRRYAQYTDGKPTSVHSYSGQQFLQRQMRSLTLGGSTSPRGSFFENVESFSVAANAWDAYNAATQAPPFGYALGGINNGWTPAAAWSTCTDPRNDAVYVLTQAKLRKLTPSATVPGQGTWSELANSPWFPEPHPGNYAGAAVDTRRGRVVFMLGSLGSGVDAYAYDLTAGTWAAITFAASAATTAMLTAPALGQDPIPGAKPTSSGVIYCKQIDRFLVRQGGAGATVYSIDPATWQVSTMSTVGGSSIVQAAGFRDQQGIFTRWLEVPQLGVVAFAPRSTSPVWTLRLW